MASTPPSPKLGKTTALVKAQSLNQRLQALVPTLTTTLSPPNVAQAGLNSWPSGGGLAVYGNGGTPITGAANQTGVWIAPDVNGDGSNYEVQVECFGAGGGGGGGNTTTGAGGGGGGEYAAETSYTVTPGKSYVWISGGGGSPGFANSGASTAGSSGGLTMFDVTNVASAHGVIAQGGQGGDVTGTGVGGNGGAGSFNSVSNDGGLGGTNAGGYASDNPLALLTNSSLWAYPPTSGQAAAWYILDDNTQGSSYLSDASGNNNNATVTSYTGGLATGVSGGFPPHQAPTLNAGANQPPFYTSNPTIANTAVHFQKGSLTKASARIQAPEFAFAGQYLTVSCWTQCDPSGTFGNTAAGSFATLLTNCDYSGQQNGYALYWRNTGTASHPNWTINFYCGRGGTTPVVSYTVGAASVGQWYQVVGTFNNGTMTLYVNGVSVGTATASFTSVLGGGYNTTMGVDPYNNTNWYFGYLSNVWLVNEGAIGPTGVAQAYGLSPALGAAGGGASGSYSGTGGTGSHPAGTSGGAGGTPVAVPAPTNAVITAGKPGVVGAASGASDIGASPSYGAGGGGAGASTSAPPAGGSLTVPFTAAATYNGNDAGAGAGLLYTPSNQGTTNVLFQGGLPTDVASGSKNSLLLLPPNFVNQFNSHIPPGNTALPMQLLLTVYNANPADNGTTILEIGYSNDTSLPSTYTGASMTGRAGFLAIPAGASQVTIDLTNSAFFNALFNTSSPPTAVVLGPGSSPTYDAFNSPTSDAFNCQIYGPGAADNSGNSLQPYLTVVYSATTGAAPLQGSYGGGGQLNLSLINNAATPVFTVDVNGNSTAASVTSGSVTSAVFSAPQSGSTGSLYGPTNPNPTAYWDNSGFHVSGTLYGNSGTLTIGDNVGISGANLAVSGSISAEGGAFTVGAGGVVTTPEINYSGGLQILGGPVSIGTSGAPQSLTLHSSIISTNYTMSAAGQLSCVTVSTSGAAAVSAALTVGGVLSANNGHPIQASGGVTFPGGGTMNSQGAGVSNPIVVNGSNTYGFSGSQLTAVSSISTILYNLVVSLRNAGVTA